MLTQARWAAFKANFLANTATITLVGGQSAAINTLTSDSAPDNLQRAADWYNALASPAYYGIRTDAPVPDILNAVTWANFTPKPAITSGNAAQATAASAYCQGKMLNLQTMLFGRTTFDATKAAQTGGVKDATTQLPSDTAFANQTGGWPSIIPILQRRSNNVEKLFALASTVLTLQNAASARGTQYDGSNGNPDVLDFQGTITGSDIYDALLNG